MDLSITRSNTNLVKDIGYLLHVMFRQNMLSSFKQEVGELSGDVKRIIPQLFLKGLVPSTDLIEDFE